jgi:acyl-CoA synthetase (AMP-forming)/AMP-acid ligase II
VDGATGRVLTYAELGSAVRRAAAGLVARGVAKGDTLALCSSNSPDFAVAYYAALAAGALVTTVNPLAPSGDIAWQLAHSGARWLIITAALAQDSVGELAAAAGVRETFAFGAAALGGPGGASGRATPFAALTGADHPDRLPTVGPGDPAVLLYSSGTTGLPKGALLSHRNLVASLCQTRAVHRVGPDDVVLTVLPLYHIFALQVSLSLGLAAGATVVTMPRFGLDGFCGLVQDYGVTRVEAVPPIVLALARHPAVPEYDLGCLRLITSGAAPLGTALASECARRLGCRVKQGYGMTELGGATHIVPDTGGGSAESVGPLLPGAQSRVIDCASGRDVGPGQPGEMLIRTPGTMRGYVDNREATTATIDADGWLHTGDVVIANREGWFTIVDRLKELIKYKGSQVAPAALEAILLAQPRGRRRRGHRPARRGSRRDPYRRSRAPPASPRYPAGRPRADGLRRRPGCAAREDPPRRVRHRHPQVAVRQDPAPAANRTRPGGRTRAAAGAGRPAAMSRLPSRRPGLFPAGQAGPAASAAQLGGTVSVITGGGRGIGRLFAARGRKPNKSPFQSGRIDQPSAGSQDQSQR